MVTRAFAGPICQSAPVIGGKSEASVAVTSGVGELTTVGATVAVAVGGREVAAGGEDVGGSGRWVGVEASGLPQAVSSAAVRTIGKTSFLIGWNCTMPLPVAETQWQGALPESVNVWPATGMNCQL